MPTIYLIPSTLSDTPVSHVLPAYNIEIVSELKHFIVENVRSARRFLKACNREIDIDSLTFGVLNVNEGADNISALMEPMERGHNMGVISEAGCPAVADPGALVVGEAHRRGYKVEPLVGPSSILLGLMASGFNGQHFAFNGYLPIDPKERSASLKKYYNQALTADTTQIFIETPYRNNKFIEQAVQTLPSSAKLCVASGLTGTQPRIVSKSIEQWRKVKTLDFDKVPTIFLIYK